ncbi:hypothetical protein [Jannaschia aquimarina]|uniref:Uncharacterized protein n=1 Tax=Jannaschia aquimarina TaxID=935700 RepID=A0A0D1EII6_9RHOB|nr:hypothetical protein [Jannaschia aquimarina]KIT17429.1 hypothetical protein jaqu_08440 [Jannaschia aquimarina]SNT23968.1 hypothetical protein SAMN05421775_108158 [Jannaschia aquimarina]
MSRPPKRKGLTPQQKKALSYARDHRPAYGQNDKAARKLVPLRKAQERRASRRKDKAVLMQTPEEALPEVRRGNWRKAPDLPLGADLEYGHFSDNAHRTGVAWDKSAAEPPHIDRARRVRRRVVRVLKGKG